MNIAQAINQGFEPTIFRGHPVEAFTVDTRSGVLQIHSGNEMQYIGLHKEPEEVDLQLVMHVKFSQELSSAGELSRGIFPVAHENILRDRNNFMRRLERGRTTRRDIEREFGISPSDEPEFGWASDPAGLF